MTKSTLDGILSGLAAAAIWGGMYVVSKVVLEVIPPFALLSLRLLLGILALGVFALRKPDSAPGGRLRLEMIAVGLVGYGVSLGFQFTGTRLSTASNGALVTSATPAFVLLFAAWLLKEPVTRQRLLALLLASLGVLAVIDPRTASLSPQLFWGNLFLIAAALTWALYSVLVRKVSQRADLLWASWLFFWGGLPVSLPAAAWELPNDPLGQITPGVILGILYLGIVSTAIAMYLWNRAFALLPAGTASLTFFAQPVVGAGLGAFFLGEKLSLFFLFGGALIGLGLWLAASEENRKMGVVQLAGEKADQV